VIRTSRILTDSISSSEAIGAGSANVKVEK